MKEYEFRTTAGSGNYITQIARFNKRDSGLVLPVGLAQIIYARETPATSESGLHIPSPMEVMMYGSSDNGASEVAPVVEKYTFVETDFTLFGKKAVETCVKVIDETDTANVVLMMNSKATNDDEKDFLQSLNIQLARKSAEADHEEPENPVNTGMYL